MQLTALWESPCSRERWLKRIYRAGSAESGPVHVDRRTPAVAARPSRGNEATPVSLRCQEPSQIRPAPANAPDASGGSSKRSPFLSSLSGGLYGCFGDSWRRPGAEHGAESFGRKRMREKKPLDLVAPERLKMAELLLGLHPLGHDRDAQAAGQGDKGRGDCRVSRVPDDSIHEGAVDLQAVGREVPEVLQGRVSRPEIVDHETDARFLEVGKTRDGLFVVSEKCALGDLEGKPLWRQPGLAEGIPDDVGEAGAAQLERRDVHRDVEGPQALLGPRFGLQAGGSKYPFADPEDQTALLRHGAESSRWDRAERGGGPAQESLEAGHLAALSVQD